MSTAQAPANTGKPIGAECSGAFGDGECKSGDCEKANDQKWYCDCDDDERSFDCATEYGVEDGEVWTCKAGTPQSQDLDYCQSNLLGRDQYPITKDRASTWNDPRLSQDEIKKLTSKPELRIKIPGLTFSEPKVIEENGTAYISIPILGEYIKTVYRYGIAAAGIMAVVIIINAGFLWLRSAGNAQVITAQKETIEKAVIGLVIAVSSYSILFFINPRLTEFQNLKVEYVKTINLEKSRDNETVQSDYNKIPGFAADATPVKVKPGAMSYGFNNVPYFGQGVAPWGTEHYGGPTCTTYAAGGCGPTSFAMVLRFYGKDVDPRHPGAIATQTKARSCRGGTNTTGEAGNNFLRALEKEYNVTIKVITNKNEALTLLRQGKPLVQGGAHVGYTNTNKLKSYKGHFIVLTGTEMVDGQEIIRVNDSGRASPENGIVYQTIPLFQNSVNRLIYISPN